MWRKIIGVVALVAVCTLGFWGVASAQSFRTGDTPNVDADEVIDSTLWIAGRTIDIAGKVQGDVFCAGQNVTISGHVTGDVLCAAQTIVISGEVDGDIRLAAQTATLTGNVDGNVTLGAQTFTQAAGSVIGGDVSTGGADVTLNGTVGRDLLLGSDTAYINGTVERNIKAGVTSLSLGNNAVVGGNLEYTSQNDAQLATGAVVRGTTTKSIPQHEERSTGSMIWGKVVFCLYLLGAMVFTALVLVLLFPRAFSAIGSYKVRNIWKPLLVGLASLIALPVLAVLSMVTIIGIPFGILVLLAWIVIGALSVIVSAFWVGRIIWRKQHNVLLIMLVGVAITAILLAIPIFGMLVWLVASLIGAGLIFIGLKNRVSKADYTLKY